MREPDEDFEPECEDEGAQCEDEGADFDDEPSLGSLDQPEDQTRGGFGSRSDREEQCEDEVDR